ALRDELGETVDRHGSAERRLFLDPNRGIEHRGHLSSPFLSPSRALLAAPFTAGCQLSGCSSSRFAFSSGTSTSSPALTMRLPSSGTSKSPRGDTFLIFTIGLLAADAHSRDESADELPH